MQHCGAQGWWREVKKLTGQQQQSHSQCPLSTMANNLCKGNTQMLADNINNFFHSVSADLSPLNPEVIPEVADVSPDEFIIEPYEVERKLSAINTRKSCGPDDIPNWFWREFSPWLAEPVCAIFNASLRHGVVPTLWKCANIVPLPKKKPPRSIQSDLRPISLTPTLSKILESFVGRWIMHELEGKLDQRQYGCLRGRSTTHELVDLLHHWHQALDNNATIRTVFIDYAKAFDHVDHTIVVEKLCRLGVCNFLIRWICSFLSNRMQRAKLSDIFSNWLILNGSMPQGSFLGPLIFLILINDLNAKCLVFKFVDDTTLSEIIEQNTVSLMNNYVTEVVDWSCNNLMNINCNKTKEMILGSMAEETFPNIIIDNNIIERVKEFKLLGVNIDHNLKWECHVNSIFNKASSRLYFLKQLQRSGLSSDELLQFYISVIRPVLEYACPVWHNSLTVEQTSKLELIQKRALRIISSSGHLTLPTLRCRRDEMCKLFFASMLNSNNCLHYLLPKPREGDVVNKLRNYISLLPATARTVRFQNSFIIHALGHYQNPVVNIV